MTSNCLQFAAARTSRAKLLTILLAALCIHGSSPGAQMTPYTFYQVNAGYSPAMDVNDAGTVVGYWVGPPVSADPTSTSLGYVWTRADGAQPIIVDPTTVKQFPQRTPINEPSASLRISGQGRWREPRAFRDLPVPIGEPRSGILAKARFPRLI